jgi:3-methyladenine DNA glycosylase AlkD
MTQQTKKYDKNNILIKIRQRLKECSDPKTKETGPKFFKEQIKLHGVKVANVTKISKEYFEHIKDQEKNDIFDTCEDLWKSGYIEESFIACNWSYYMRERYSSNDFLIFEEWLKSYVTNWASCDTLCNHTIGTFIVKYPEYLSKIIKWTESDNRWLCRGAAATLIIPARKGKFLKEILNIADRLLLNQDYLVQKGYGWMLKAASEAHEKEIFRYVMKNKDKMPRTSLRYAIEKMPKELKKEAMKK